MHAAEQAETTADWMLHRVRAARGRLWDEGPWQRPLADIDARRAALWVFATRRVRGVSPAIARGLVAWARGQRPVDLLMHAPAPAAVLELQAAGRRCVSLLDDAAAHARGDRLHPDGLSFALHDLHHLEKFVEPQHHVGQVGFFRCMRRALADSEFVALQRTFDDTWTADRNYVIADMNGSAVFLFATLKMRLAMAMRRRVAAAADQPAPSGGPLNAEEQRALAPALETLFSAMGLPPALGDEARVVSANRAFPDHARRLLLHFEAAGAQVSR